MSGTFKLKSLENIREEIATDVGLDPDDDKDLLDKISSREYKRYKNEKSAVKQKLDHSAGRKGYKATLMKLGFNPKTGEPLKRSGSKKKDKKSSDKDIDRESLKKEIRNELKNEAKLDKLGLSEKLNRRIMNFAKYEKKTVEEALKTSFIQKMIEEETDDINENQSFFISKRGGGMKKGKRTKKNLDNIDKKEIADMDEKDFEELEKDIQDAADEKSK